MKKTLITFLFLSLIIVATLIACTKERPNVDKFETIVKK